jgi:hypothetical protein
MTKQTLLLISMPHWLPVIVHVFQQRGASLMFLTIHDAVDSFKKPYTLYKFAQYQNSTAY